MASDPKPTTIEEYLAALPEDRRAEGAALRALVVDNLPAGYEEQVLWGMPTYAVPLERTGPTYNGQPLAYVSFSARKAGWSLYLMGLYADSEEDRSFRERWAGPKKLDLGKSCLRFKQLDDLDLPLVAATIAGTSVDAFVDASERARHSG